MGKIKGGREAGQVDQNIANYHKIIGVNDSFGDGPC